MKQPPPNELMWTHFQPLWKVLCQHGNANHDFLLAGGYGLFLKQLWLKETQGTTSIVPLNRWQSDSPRSTKDVDLIVNLELIAQEKANGTITQVVTQCGFQVCPKNPRWKFLKPVPSDQTIVLEFHAETPIEHTDLRVEGHRIKNRKRLGDAGFHAFKNPEAIGGNLHPFEFQHSGLDIRVPNAITWCIMKLTAADDRRRKADDPKNAESKRAESNAQAAKHASDVLRIVAMVTKTEQATLADVSQNLSPTPEFKKAAAIVSEAFSSPSQWGVLFQRTQWEAEDINTMLAVLRGWFQLT